MTTSARAFQDFDLLVRHVEFNTNPNDRLSLRRRHVFNSDVIRCFLLMAKSIKLEDNACFRQASVERRVLIVARQLFLSVRSGDTFARSAVTRAINGRHSVEDCIDWVAVWGAFSQEAPLRGMRDRYWVKPVESRLLKDCGLGAHRLIEYAEELVRSADSSHFRDYKTRSALHEGSGAMDSSLTPRGPMSSDGRISSS